jgi:hypothetical protein
MVLIVRVLICVQKEQNSRASPSLSRRIPSHPSSSLRERYKSALEPRQRTLLPERPTAPFRCSSLRSEELQTIEKALQKKIRRASPAGAISSRASESVLPSNRPRIRVQSSAHSISIIIPEGAKLPVVATIQGEGPFDLDTDMFSSLFTRSRSSSPKATKARKNPINVSEASTPAPAESGVSAEGQVFGPNQKQITDQHVATLQYLEHPARKTDKKKTESHATEPLAEAEVMQEITAADSDGLNHNAAVKSGSETSREQGLNDNTATPVVARPSPRLFTQSESAIGVLQDSAGPFGPPNPRSVPEIKIHRPSVTEPALGTLAINGNKQSFPESTPPDGNAATSAAVLAGGCTLSSAATPVQVVQGMSLVRPLTAVPSIGTLPSVETTKRKVKRRERFVRKLRKLIVRKHLLQILVGQDLATVIHSSVNISDDVTPAAPVPIPVVDGPSDVLQICVRHKERRRDVRQKNLDRKIAREKLLAEAEGVHRCRLCRGLTRTRHLRRFHSLMLDRQRPHIGRLRRCSMASKRIQAYKCRYERRFWGIDNEALKVNVVADASAPVTQHERAPAIAETPLPGHDGARSKK